MAGDSVAVTSFFQEFLSPTIYKRTQGRIARQVTFAAVAISIALGCWQLSNHWADANQVYQFLIPGALLAVGLWTAYRAVNYPKFADFLIAVEAEMNKVSWPSRKELIRSTIVVLVTIFLLASVLFLYDFLWKFILNDLLHITGVSLPSDVPVE